jgi:DNA repair protein RadA/Sms
MARTQTAYVCQACGSAHPKWSGRCDDCGAWNTLVEEQAAPPSGASARRTGKGRPVTLETLASVSAPPERRTTGVAEFDRVTGGGLVAGSALLLGGDPGVGKSTLILQALAAYARKTPPVVYVSGEEALDQVRLRAARMGLAQAPVQLGSATSVEDILATLAAGPVLRYAKASGTAVILVGHVTKDGQIAGPKAVEHLVDAVLYFEGERGHHFRILRAVKNRFGATDEIGVFEMTGTGLEEVRNPSALFLGDRSGLSPARPFSPASRARARCSLKSRPW